MKTVLIWLALCFGTLMTTCANGTAYLFSYFINDSRDGLHLAYSYDGLNWTALNGGKSYLLPVVGKDKLMRDPSICQAPDGTFHMVWTSSWTDRIIGYASSRDLIHWSEQRVIPVMMHEPTAHNCWAPELFYNEPSQTYYIFWATTIPGRHKEVATSESEKGLNHRMYYVTTKDFQTFSKTKMFFNPDFSVIDAAIVKDPKNEDLIMVVKNENSNPPEKNLRITRTRNLSKGFPTKVSPSITGNYWAEGPAPLFVGDTLYVYFDKYRDHRYGAVRSLDHGETWEDVSDLVSFPRGIRHGTAFAVDASVVETLIANRNYNPLIPDNLADPSLSKFGDTYYLYATTDLDYGLGRAGTPVVWKSKDFVNWSFEGSHIQGFDWAKGYDWVNDKGEKKTGYFRYWAPGKVIEQNGTYYLYVTFVKPDEKMGTYVMIADRPDGPFRFAEGNGLFAPGVEGGNGYLFWRRRLAARLSADRLHIEGEPLTMQTARQGYSEGPLMFKRKGIYYYLYTIGGDERYQYAYVMSKVSPLGPYEYPEQDIVSTTDYEQGVFGPGHGCVFNTDEDHYYFAYLEFGRRSTNRQTYVNRLEFNEDGTIRPVKLSLDGVGPLRKVKGRKEIKADTVYASSTAAPLFIEPMKDDLCRRTEYFVPAFAVDGANGSRWMAAEGDKDKWLVADLGRSRKIRCSEIYFVRPTAGHAYQLEGSVDGTTWRKCGGHDDLRMQSPHVDEPKGKYRFLRVRISEGVAGVWEWNIY